MNVPRNQTRIDRGHRLGGEDRRLLVTLAVAADVAWGVLFVWSLGQVNALFEGIFESLPAWLLVILIVVLFIPHVADFMLAPFEDLIDWRRGRARAREATAMLTAAEAGDLASVSTAVTAHPSLVNLGDEQGRTALHLAAGRGHNELAQWLLDHGADPFARTDGGLTPLDVALAENSPGVGRIIMGHVRRSLSRTR
jgi:hypothetical protein